MRLGRAVAALTTTAVFARGSGAWARQFERQVCTISSSGIIQRSQRTMSSVCSKRLRSVQLLDGGTGEELFKRGMPDDRKIWSAAAVVNEQYHDLLIDVHAAFLNAGSDFITCNNYGITPGVGFPEEEIVKYTDIAGELAAKARMKAAKPEAKICGSLPPLLESYRADRVPPHDEGVHLYAVIASALDVHVDCYLAETLSSVAEARMALTAVQDYRKPVMVSFTLNSKGQLRSGERVVDAVRQLVHFAKVSAPTLRLLAVLFNCSEPESISQAFEYIDQDAQLRMELEDARVRLGAYANRLTRIPDDWALAESNEPQAMRTDVGVEHYAQFVDQWIEMGAEIIGGCCGIGPEYIEALDKHLKARGLRDQLAAEDKPTF